MKGLVSNYILAALIGILLSQIAHGEEYAYVNFTGNVTANYSAAYAQGENGTNYIMDGNTLVFRSQTDFGKPIAITHGENYVLVEFAQTSQEGVMPNLEWMAANGIIAGWNGEYYEQIGSGLDHMLVFSMDRVDLDGPFGKMGRLIAPMEYANGTRMQYIYSLELPPEALGAPITAAALPAQADAVPETSAGAPIPEIYGAGEIPPQMPASAPMAQKGMPEIARGAANTEIGVGAAGAGQPALYAEDSGKAQPDFGFLPIVAGVILVAMAAMMLMRQGMVTVQEEAPEVMMAMANETRVAIMQDLTETERIPTDISNRVGKSKATISEHLEQLVGAGLVEKVQTPGRKFVYYRLSHKGKVVLLRRKAA